MNRKIKIIVFVSVVVLMTGAYITLFLKEYNEVLPLKNSWDKPVPNQKVPHGLVSLNAKDCGVCHVQHYQEWLNSTHAHAWTDKQFQSELTKESSPFMCVNCHIPLQNQQPDIVTGLIKGDIYKPVKEPNPLFDAKLQTEGITCAGCHVRNNTIIGTNGSLSPPHQVQKDVLQLSEKLCFGCHNASAVITPELACSFETGDEWKSGPFFGKKNCISCHMQEINRPLVPGMPVRKSHFHGFPGSGIPKSKNHHPERLESLDFSTSIVKPKYNILDTLSFNVSLTNLHAGHRVPSGDPERFLLTEIKLQNKEGKIIDTLIKRIGEEWQWHPSAKKISDNNLNPGEKRTYYFNKPMLMKGNYSLTVKVTKHRLTTKSAAYNKLGSDYPLEISVFERTFNFSVM